MGHDTQVEVDDVTWFKGYGPVALAGGECDHACEHRDTRTIAWGPSLRHYELVRCDNCMCRAWESAVLGGKGGIPNSHPWLKVAGTAPRGEG